MSTLQLFLQIQCILQDIGSHIATPRSTTTTAKLGQLKVYVVMNVSDQIQVNLPFLYIYLNITYLNVLKLEA